MIEVTHVITSLEIGGAQRMLSLLLERMDRREFRSRVVSLLGGGALADRIRDLGVEIRDLGMRAGWPDPRGVLRLRRVLAEHPPDVLQTWLYHADLVGTLATRLSRGPALAWNLRRTFSPRTSSGLAARISPRLCALLSRVPDLVVTNSTSGRESHARIGYRPRRWELVPNGFDVEAFAPDPGARKDLRAEIGADEEAVVAGFVGRWHPVKNVEGVLRVSRALRDEHPELHLVLIGSGLGSGDPAFGAATELLAAPDRIHGLGPREDVARLMAGMDFLVLSSLDEGFPMVLGEALACGVPCVTTPVGDAAEIVGPAGIVLAGTDDESLVDGVRRMTRTSTAERRRLGEIGRARTRARFDLGAVVRRYEELYRELAAGKA